MNDRYLAIRKRLERSEPVSLVGPPALVAAFEAKDADLAWALDEIERLRKIVRMYEVVKS